MYYHVLLFILYVGGLMKTLSKYNTVQELTENATEMHNSVRSMLLSANIPLSPEVESAIEESFPSSHSHNQEETKTTPSFSPSTSSAINVKGKGKGRLSSEVTHSSLRYQAIFESNIDDMRTMVSHYLDDYLLFGIPLREAEVSLLTDGGNISLSEALSITNL